MASTDADIISNSHITFLTSSYLDDWFVLSVNNVEYLLSIAVQGFKDNEILFWFVYLYNIHNPIVVGYLEREHLLAKLAI
jgi:hypothetical protein